MAKKRKQSFEQWCQDNDREDLLREFFCVFAQGCKKNALCTFTFGNVNIN